MTLERATVLFCTGWDKEVGTLATMRAFLPDGGGGGILAGLPLKGVGEDTISLDPATAWIFLTT